MATCIPYSQGVPSTDSLGNLFWTGPPLWWDDVSGPIPALNKRIDDPRWLGALRLTYPTSGTGAGEHVAFRALHHTAGGVTSLYLSWHVKVDPQLSDDADRVYVGFWRGSTSPAFVFKIPAFTAVADFTAEKTGVPRTFRGTKSGTTWTFSPVAAADEPDWVGNFARVWVTTATKRWAVHMRVPLITSGDLTDSGINLGTSFYMWFDLQADTPGTMAAPYRWPRTSAAITGLTGFPSPDDPPPGGWDQFQLGNPGAPGCAKGVSLEQIDIGTENADPHRILWSRTPPIPKNTLFARPKNETGSTIPSGGLAARFRMANWGSAPDWEQVPNPGVLWTDVPNGNVTNESDILDTQKGTLKFDWTLTTQEIADFDPPGGGPANRRAKQCILVELSGAGLTFVNDSTWNNFTVAKSSTFRDEADISVLGLGSLGGSDRDVYLYLETSNMPRTTAQPHEPKRKPPVVRRRREVGIEGDEVLAGGSSVLAVGGGRVPQTLDDIVEAHPTLRVHVYNDTGETVTEDGVTRKVLQPQTSYGYVVDHQGPLYGWNYKLTGPGLTEIAPDFYKLSVPNDGFVTVTNEIEALEKPRPPEVSLKGCLLLVLAFLGAIVAALRKLFK